MSDVNDGKAWSVVTRLTDLIREQSSQESISPEAEQLASSIGQAGFPASPSISLQPGADIDWH